MARHVKVGDQVIVTAGDDRGKTGELIRIDTKRDRVFVKGLNLQTKHLRRTQQNPRGDTIVREGPIHISNVSPVVGGKPTRVRFPRNKNGQKVRVAARDGSELSTVSAPKEGRGGS